MGDSKKKCSAWIPGEMKARDIEEETERQKGEKEGDEETYRDKERERKQK